MSDEHTVRRAGHDFLVKTEGTVWLVWAADGLHPVGYAEDEATLSTLLRGYAKGIERGRLIGEQILRQRAAEVLGLVTPESLPERVEARVADEQWRRRHAGLSEQAPEYSGDHSDNTLRPFLVAWDDGDTARQMPIDAIDEAEARQKAIDYCRRTYNKDPAGLRVKPLMAADFERVRLAASGKADG